MAIQTPYEKLPISINVFNSINVKDQAQIEQNDDVKQLIEQLNSKLSYKLKKNVLLSFNINSSIITSNNEFYLNFEKQLFNEINLNKDKF